MARKKANEIAARAAGGAPNRGGSNNGAGNAPERASRARQRQRLIDACISALHIHGPSRTTVEKVVALADMSPGIVRFYFDSKDAMLVASLAYLAAEFEERVMTPVSRLKDTPVQALEQLVELYLDPDIASPRKVSVWYSFWGEASSRQEYLDICGKKDDDFARLVRELIEELIAQTGQSHLDPDGVALGLIGVLEVLWQGFAFTGEAEIDRDAAKRRSFAFLRSVFPGQFAARAALDPTATAGVVRAAPAAAANLPAWAYSDNALLMLERDRLFRPSWQLVGHEADIPRVGDFLTADLPGERVLVLRSSDTRILAFRNSCRKRPHALLTERRGHLSSTIECDVHELEYGLDGRFRSGNLSADLTPLELSLPGKFILVRAMAARNADPASTALLEIAGAPSGDWESLPDLKPAASGEMAVAADWKLMVEQWLDALPRPNGVQRTFLAPNQLLELSSTGALILQVIPESPGRSRIRRLDYSVMKSGSAKVGGTRAAATKVDTGNSKSAAALQPLAWLQQDIEVAESTQAGLAAGAGEADDAAPVSPALAEFRRSVVTLLPGVEGARRGG
jgi:TetR/AcrR family transcriptional repressor of bet genes